MSESNHSVQKSLENETIAVVMNLGSETEEVCVKESAPKLPDNMFVYTSSVHSGLGFGKKGNISKGDGEGCVQLRPFATMVLSTSQGAITSRSIIFCFLVSIFAPHLHFKMKRTESLP
ncbi:unnamed protein product [Bemisia tabaci]|uniref:Uncharacterized protein n=1 Tax=Bemisia tabaci TaxID=7038 RepID=A0A9P0F5H9_BEMTA|nr:unnamed protein product [Bemisia tabaci]